MSFTFDSNAWYQFFIGDQSNTGVQAYDINNTGTGAIIGRLLNVTTVVNSFQWQVLAIGGTNTYIIRSRYLGKQWTMNSFWAPVANLQNMDTRVRTDAYTSVDLIPKSAQWIIDSTADGTGKFYLSTVQNGTSWHLDSNSGVMYLRDAVQGASTNGMKWTFTSVSAINDAQWSYPATATSSASAKSTSSATAGTSATPASNTAQATGSASADATSTLSTSLSSSSSSSTSGATPTSNSNVPLGPIIGGVLGGLAVIFLIVAALGFYHRQKRLALAESRRRGNHPDSELDGQQVYPGSRTMTATTINSKPGLHEKHSQSIMQQKVPQYAHPANRPWAEPTELPANEYSYYYKPSPGGTTDSASSRY